MYVEAVHIKSSILTDVGFDDHKRLPFARNIEKLCDKYPEPISLEDFELMIQDLLKTLLLYKANNAQTRACKYQGSSWPDWIYKIKIIAYKITKFWLSAH